MASNQLFLDHYHQVKDQLFSFLMVRVNYDTAVAEDLLMDTVLRAFEHFEQFDEKKGSFKAWIFTIAYRLLMNTWRDKKATVSIDELEESGVYVATEDFKDMTDQKLEHKKIMKTMSRLSDEEGELISMKYFQDLSTKDMAAITGKKEGAVRTSLSRALKRFSNLYKKIY